MTSYYSCNLKYKTTNNVFTGQHGVTYKTGTFDEKGVVDSIKLNQGLGKTKEIGSKISIKNIKNDKKGLETNDNVLPWRKGILIDRIRKTSVEAKSLITENVFIEPTESGDLITVTQEGTFTYTYVTEQIFTLIQNKIDTKDVEKAKQIINQVLVKKMKKGNIVSLNENDKNEIVGEVTNKLTQLYTKKVNNKSFAKDILNKVLTRSMEKEQIIQPYTMEQEQQKENETFLTTTEMILKNQKQKKHVQLSEEIIEQNKSKKNEKDIRLEDENLINKKYPGQIYIGEQHNDNYEIVPDEYKPKLKTENIENVESKSQHHHNIRPWLIKQNEDQISHKDYSPQEKDVLKNKKAIINQYITTKEQTKTITPWTEEKIILKKSATTKSKIDNEKIDDTPEIITDKKVSTPWTEENVSLKKTSTEKKEPTKETLENVILKPVKNYEDELKRKGEKQQLEDTALNVTEPRTQKRSDIPWREETVTLKKTKTQKQPLSKESIEEVTLKPLKKPVVEDIPGEEETPVKETTEVVETVVEKGRRRGVKKTDTDEKGEVQETEEVVEDKPTIEEIEDIPKEDISTEPQRKSSVPWREETVTLKKTKTQKQPLTKESVEQVTLKPLKKPVVDDIPVKEDTPITETTEVVETGRRRRVKKTVTDEKGEVQETEEVVEGKPTVKEIEDIPAEDISTEPQRKSSVPWREETVTLKKTKTQKQ
ncbi:titin, partial [Aphis craccivora]